MRKRLPAAPGVSGDTLPGPADETETSILARPRALEALVLLRAHELQGEADHLTAGEFQTRILLTTRHAAKLRAYLAHWGLVTVEEGQEGKRLFVRMRLTAKGRRIADAAGEILRSAHGANPPLRQPRDLE